MDSAAPASGTRRPAGGGLDSENSRRRRAPEGSSARFARLASRVVPTQSRADTVGWLVAWFVLAAVAVQLVLIVIDRLGYELWPAYDTYAYELAAQHVVNGQALYSTALIWTAGAYKYPPIFAQLVVPIAFLPELYVDWIWRLISVLCLRYLSGSWKLALVAMLQWPVMLELGFGNVTLALGAVALWSFRDSRAAYLLPWFAGMKFGPVLLLPYLWATRPQIRRPIVVGCGVFAAACLGSFLVAPGLWWDYAGTFGWEAASQMQAQYVYAIVPNHGGTDFAIRFGMAAAAIVVAIRWKLDWLAFVAATATMPIFSLTRLAVLVALWPLCLRGLADRWRRTGGPWARRLTATLVHLDMLPSMTTDAAAAAAPAGGM